MTTMWAIQGACFCALNPKPPTLHRTEIRRGTDTSGLLVASSRFGCLKPVASVPNLRCHPYMIVRIVYVRV